jgi:hypothetical protein
MLKDLRSFATFVSCLMVVLYMLLYVRTCFADVGPKPPVKYNVDIEGAKIISEGGYLWFHVVNHDVPLSVSISFPSDVKVIGNASNSVDLETNESGDFYFQVPYYWSQPPVSIPPSLTKELRFNFGIYRPSSYHEIGESVEFDVTAVPLSSRGDNQGLLYLTVFAAVAVVITTVILTARLSREEKRS